MKGHSGRGISQGRIPELVQSEENMVVGGGWPGVRRRVSPQGSGLANKMRRVSTWRGSLEWLVPVKKGEDGIFLRVYTHMHVCVY